MFYPAPTLRWIRSLVLLSIFWLDTSTVQSGWQDNLRPRMFLQPQLHSDYQIFYGNTSEVDHFGVVLVDHHHILLGARNIMYKLSVPDLQVRQKLEWSASEQDKSVCMVKGKSEISCQNYIKVLKKFDNDEGRYLVCGTNAFKPECREYVVDVERKTYLMAKKSKGVGMCPFSPDHNSTAVLVGDQLYAGTAADYQGVDPIIYRDPLRTSQFDYKLLDNPSFVGSFEKDDFVYFFFREGAVEYMNCGKAVFSRVARVCKNDVGGTRSLNAKWTSFLKARLNCSVPGYYPFYFNEIQDISQLIQGIYADEEDSIVYGIFSTPPNSIGGSAVCSFRLRDISAAFDGQFKKQRSGDDNWLPVEPHLVPEPRPGSCPNNSKELSDANLNFIKNHPLMNEAVPPFFGAPVLIRTGINTGFTSIGVDPQVAAPDGSKFDVIYVGTSSGVLLKAVNSLAPKSKIRARPVIIEEIEVMEDQSSISQVSIVRSSKGKGHVLVTSADTIKSLNLYHCDKADNCHKCVALQDPYCAWNVREKRCQGALGWAKGSQAAFLQSVPTGRHPSCPGGSLLSTAGELGTVINQILDGGDISKHEKEEQQQVQVTRSRETGASNNPKVESSVVMFSLEKFIITVSAGAVAALVVGFVTGYCCGRKCQKEESNVPYADAEYEYFEQRQLPARPLGQDGSRPLAPGLQPLLQHTDYKRPQDETLYAEPILINHHVNVSNPLGTTLGSKLQYPIQQYPNGPGQVNSGGMTLVTGGPLVTSGGLVGGGLIQYNHPANKFNTISNLHKRGGNRSTGGSGEPSPAGETGGIYEKGGILLLNKGGRVVGSNFPLPTGDTTPVTSGSNNVYHMGTLSRAGKARERELDKEKQQVVDSAYGTTRSVKKVYL